MTQCNMICVISEIDQCSFESCLEAIGSWNSEAPRHRQARDA